MHPRFTLALAAAAALGLAACDTEPNEPDERIVGATTDPDAVDVDLPAIPVEYPEVPVNPQATVDYAGSYAQTLPGGRTRTIALADDGTYFIRDEAGRESTGTFSRSSDNRRILIRRDGETKVYAVADGVLYRLADENAPIAGQRTAEQTFRRVVGAAGSLDGSVQGVPGE